MALPIGIRRGVGLGQIGRPNLPGYYSPSGLGSRFSMGPVGSGPVLSDVGVLRTGRGTSRPTGGESSFIGLRGRLDATDVIDGLVSINDAFQRLPGDTLEALGPEWRRFLIANTPVGPWRDLSHSKAQTLGAMIGALPDASMITPSSDFDAQITRFYASLGKAQNPMTTGARDTEFRPFIGSQVRRIGGKFGQGYRGFETAWGPALGVGGIMSDAFTGNPTTVNVAAGGRLADANYVKYKSVKSFGQLQATNLSYYAWFVENGFTSNFRPVVGAPKEEIAFYVHLNQLGPGYPGIAQIAQIRRSIVPTAGGRDIGDISGLAAKAGEIAVSGELSEAADVFLSEMEKGGVTAGPGSKEIPAPDMIPFIRRFAPLMVPGQFFFSKGTDEFLQFAAGQIQRGVYDVANAIWYEHADYGEIKAVAERTKGGVARYRHARGSSGRAGSFAPRPT